MTIYIVTEYTQTAEVKIYAVCKDEFTAQSLCEFGSKRLYYSMEVKG